MSCTLAFNLLYVYMVELYPTVIRSTAASAGSFVARLGSILAPFIAQLVREGVLNIKYTFIYLICILGQNLIINSTEFLYSAFSMISSKCFTQYYPIKDN